MTCMRRLKVFEYACGEHVKEVTGNAPISVDWVDVNKGDQSRPELRSRLVVQETMRVSTLGPRRICVAGGTSIFVVKRHD